MAEKKSLVEETLLQMKNLEDVISENAKGILHSTMKEEIGELVKESLKEAEEETDIETDTDMEDMDSETDTDMEDMDSETDTDVDMDVDTDMEDDEMDVETDMEDEESVDLRGMSFREVADIINNMSDDDKIVVVKDEGDSEEDEDEDMSDEEDESDSIKESMESYEDFDMDSEMDFSKSEKIDSDFSGLMDSEDEEEDEEYSDFSGLMDSENMDEEEVVYEIEMNNEEENLEDMSMYEMDEEDEFEEISMSEDDYNTVEEGFKPKGKGFGKASKFKFKKQAGGFKETMKKGTKGVGMGKPKFEYKESKKMDMKKVGGETSEASRTLGSGRRFGRKGLPKPKAAPRHLNVESVNKEVTLLREKNEEYRKALNIFRTKLNEVAIFNSNLAYATRLFTEHSTTKQEKINILRRFDGAESLKESKSLYKTIKEELSSQDSASVVKESIQEKIERAPQSGSAASLIESKTYENPQFMRMKDLMSKMNIIK